MSKRKKLGVIIWPAHIQFEGIDAILDRLTDAGVTAVATVPSVVEPTDDLKAGRREPPDDGGEGMARVVDRPVWGKTSLHLRSAPSYEPNQSLYQGLKWRPREANGLTSNHGHVIGSFIEKARTCGFEVYLQVQVSHIPGMEPEDSHLPGIESDLPRLPNQEFPRRRMVHFASIASDDVRQYFCAMLRDVLLAYPGINGLLLDRAEQSVYTVGDAFVDFGPHAKAKAKEMGFDFEMMRSASDRAYHALGRVSTNDVRRISDPSALPYEVAQGLRNNPGLGEALRFRAKLATSYLRELREAVDSVSPGKELVPITFPPPLSLLTGVDFRVYADYSDTILVKLFTMHWPLIVRYWAREILSVNKDLDEASLVRALSVTFGFEDGDYGRTVEDYRYPGPHQPHRAGREAQLRKIRQASAAAGGHVPVLPSVHAYGPVWDVQNRFRVGWQAGTSGMWVNRYGYLSAEKLAVLKALDTDSPRQA